VIALGVIDWAQTEALLEKNIRYIKNSKKIFVDVSRLGHLNQNDYRVFPTADMKGYTIEKRTEKGFVRMHSAYEPHREGRLLAEKIINQDSEGEVYIRFGFGFGYLFNYLLPCLKDIKGEVVVYEPSYDVFNYFIRLFDISVFFNGYEIRLFVSDDVSDVRKILPYTVRKALAKTYSDYTLGYYIFYENEIKKCIQSIKNFAGVEQSNRDTFALFKNKWATNIVINFPYILDSVGCEGFLGKLKGKPAILVSSGPSLNKNVHLLKEVQGKVFIIAAYTSVKTLEAHGIKPDMFFAIDAQQVAYEVDENYGIKDIPFVLYSSIGNDVVKAHDTNNFFVSTPKQLVMSAVYHSIMEYIGKPMTYEYISEGGNVAHSIVELLRLMDVQTIIMIGQDLAFTGGKHHAEEYLTGQNTYGENIFDHKTRLMVEDIYGEQVETDIVFQLSIEKFGEFAARSIKVVDATEGGAKIKNTEIITLREAIDKYMTEYTDPNFTKSIISEARTKGVVYDASDKQKAINYFKEMLIQCNKVPKIADEALLVAEKITKLYRFNRIPLPKELNKPMKMLKGYTEQIDSHKLAADAIFASWYADAAFEMSLKRDDDPDGLFYTKVTSFAIRAIKQSCEVLIPALKDTIEKLINEDV